jgi:hypothetical protein
LSKKRGKIIKLQRLVAVGSVAGWIWNLAGITARADTKASSNPLSLLSGIDNAFGVFVEVVQLYALLFRVPPRDCIATFFEYKKGVCGSANAFSKNDHSQLITAAMSFTYLVGIKRTAAGSHSRSDQCAFLSTSNTADAGACDCRSDNR